MVMAVKGCACFYADSDCLVCPSEKPLCRTGVRRRLLCWLKKCHAWISWRKKMQARILATLCAIETVEFCGSQVSQTSRPRAICDAAARSLHQLLDVSAVPRHGNISGVRLISAWRLNSLALQSNSCRRLKCGICK